MTQLLRAGFLPATNPFGIAKFVTILLAPVEIPISVPTLAPGAVLGAVLIGGVDPLRVVGNLVMINMRGVIVVDKRISVVMRVAIVVRAQETTAQRAGGDWAVFALRFPSVVGFRSLDRRAPSVSPATLAEDGPFVNVASLGRGGIGS